MTWHTKHWGSQRSALAKSGEPMGFMKDEELAGRVARLLNFDDSRKLREARKAKEAAE